MIFLLVLIALAALAAIGVGSSYLRANPAPAGTVGQWFATLQGPRAIGAGLVAAGAIAFVLVLVLRP